MRIINAALENKPPSNKRRTSEINAAAFIRGNTVILVLSFISVLDYMFWYIKCHSCTNMFTQAMCMHGIIVVVDYTSYQSL